jgi:MATE family multidrug resistance protein
MGKLVGKGVQESKLLWHIAFPAILTAVFQFSVGFVTVGFAGHIGEVELAAVAVVENVIEGFAYGILVSTTYLFRTHGPTYCCSLLIILTHR